MWLSERVGAQAGVTMSEIKRRGMVHACIPVSDLDASKKFYTEMLGLNFVNFSPVYQLIFLTAGKDYLILAKSETPINPNPEGQRRVHHAFAVHPGAATTTPRRSC